MHRGFARGLIIGGIIGATISAMANSDMMGRGGRRRISRSGRNILRKSGNLVEDVIDLFR